jgi:Endomembrane protein 70
MLKNETCVKICDVVIPQEDVPFINDRIQEGYSIRYLVDGLPIAEQVILEDTHEICQSAGSIARLIPRRFRATDTVTTPHQSTR